MRPVEGIWAALNKAVNDGGWGTTPIMTLKGQFILKAHQIPFPNNLQLAPEMAIGPSTIRNSFGMYSTIHVVVP